MEQPLVSVNDGRVDFEAFSLIIPKLEIKSPVYWLRGPNGSGKTTLMRILLGLQPLSSGGIKRNTDRFGYVPQNYREALFPWLSAKENLDLFGEDNEFALKWVAELGLKNNELKRRAHQLSGGQAQRLVLARECSLFPNMLILDEPFSALDALTNKKAGEIISGIVKDTNVHIIITTHMALPKSISDLDVIELDIYRETDELARVVVS